MASFVSLSAIFSPPRPLAVDLQEHALDFLAGPLSLEFQAHQHVFLKRSDKVKATLRIAKFEQGVCKITPWKWTPGSRLNE